MIVFLLLITESFVNVGAFCPVTCDCSTKDVISCNDQSITSIAKLAIPNNFTYIIISNTQATELTDWSFPEMPLALRLSLEGNKFSTITAAAFQKFPFLKSLKLTHNNLSTLSSGVFHPLIHLEQLFLDRNVLMRLEPQMFDTLSDLKELALNRNNLTELPAGLLDQLVKLQVLNLSRNKLNVLPKNIFGSLFKLTQLVIYDNNLVEITSWMFSNLTELVELNMRSNLIQIIDKDAFYHLPKLKKLSLQKNHLKTLPDGLFLHLPMLVALSFYENPLMELPTVLFGKMDYLKSFWLYHTDLTTIPNFFFSNLTNLELLVLTRNKNLHTLPPDSFSGLSKLVELALHTNNFSSLGEGLFKELQQLQILSLYNNNFEVLPENFFHPQKNLQTVYLNSTKIKTLPGNLFTGLTNLQMVRLDGNPWTCDCKLKDFKVWLEMNKGKIKNIMSLVCTSPRTLQGIPVLEVEALICPYTITTAEDKSSFMVTTGSNSWYGFTNVSQGTLPSDVTVTSSIGNQFLNETHSSLSDPTTDWYYDDTTSPSLLSHLGTTTETILSEYDLHHIKNIFRLSLPCGKIFYYALLLNTVLQVLTLLLTCFSLMKIKILYNYFDSCTEPVVLLRILIPLSSNPRSSTIEM
ncbi:platelet glycoprotein V-like [Pseudophryne corroboree]|uniref:platelet glycoprotein V-like n=1 Tax=Pseudophryne corroboree TaxID=495146 RepID=UPI003081B9E3